MAAAVSTSASASASASASNPAECSVCTDVITGNALVCAHCKYSSCTDCARHYWDDHPMNPPACMNCRKVFTLENLAMAFSKTAAHKGLENARREALFRAETAYGMETQTVLFPIIHVYEKLVNNLELKRLELEKTETEYWAARMRMYEARRECKRANITTAPSKRGRHDQNVKENAREECGRLHGRVTQMETEMMALYETVKRVHDIIAFTELRQVETTFRAFFRYQHHRCNFDDEDVRRFSPGLLRAQGETIDLTLDDADVGGAAPAADGTAEAVVPDALTTRQVRGLGGLWGVSPQFYPPLLTRGGVGGLPPRRRRAVWRRARAPGAWVYTPAQTGCVWCVAWSTARAAPRRSRTPPRRRRMGWQELLPRTRLVHPTGRKPRLRPSTCATPQTWRRQSFWPLQPSHARGAMPLSRAPKVVRR